MSRMAFIVGIYGEIHTVTLQKIALITYCLTDFNLWKICSNESLKLPFFRVIFYVHGILCTNGSCNEHPVEYKSISGLILRGSHWVSNEKVV